MPRGTEWIRMVTLLRIMLVALLVFSLYQLATYWHNSMENRRALNDIQELYYQQQAVPPYKQDIVVDRTLYNAGSKPINKTDSADLEHSKQSQKLAQTERFAQLKEINEDIVGWIQIPDTEIDYPIVQGEDNEYYLKHTFEKIKNVSGAIFMDYRNDPELQDANTIVYGHHMKNGTMFKALQNYKDLDFFNKHRIIMYDTPTGHYEWEVFSVYVTSTEFYYIQPTFKTNEQYATFLNKIHSKSMHPSEITLVDQDRILTLSTCSYEFDNARLVIHARLL
ncbi:SrtB family sortase [Paenibacillus baekrokdamisoli]|uniref:SrtB family sortase n=2 Tax=Paenibacillus baekrokdamisoli TaxID=1712516 RepID=A0A3G9J181_9BACL|nr:SrtB family sortase [Paenibacillus baekrokdamisoli]